MIGMLVLCYSKKSCLFLDTGKTLSLQFTTLYFTHGLSTVGKMLELAECDRFVDNMKDQSKTFELRMCIFFILFFIFFK